MKNNNFGKIGISIFGTGVDLWAETDDTLYKGSTITLEKF